MWVLVSLLALDTECCLKKKKKTWLLASSTAIGIHTTLPPLHKSNSVFPALFTYSRLTKIHQSSLFDSFITPVDRIAALYNTHTTNYRLHCIFKALHMNVLHIGTSMKRLSHTRLWFTKCQHIFLKSDMSDLAVPLICKIQEILHIIHDHSKLRETSFVTLPR